MGGCLEGPIYCPIPSCDWQGPEASAPGHVAKDHPELVGHYTMVCCPVSSCRGKTKGENYIKHYKGHLPGYRKTCEWCEEKLARGTKYEIDRHLETCRKFPANMRDTADEPGAAGAPIVLLQRASQEFDGTTLHKSTAKLTSNQITNAPGEAVAHLADSRSEWEGEIQAGPSGRRVGQFRTASVNGISAKAANTQPAMSDESSHVKGDGIPAPQPPKIKLIIRGTKRVSEVSFAEQVTEPQGHGKELQVESSHSQQPLRRSKRIRSSPPTDSMPVALSPSPLRRK